MIKVKFSSTDEFLTELCRDASKVQGKIVRLTQIHEGDGTAPLRYVSVVAGALISDRLVELSVPCGQDWGKGFGETERSQKRAKEMMTRIEKTARGLGLEVRQGLYESEGGDGK